jgi:hypothetical protein
VFCNKNCNNYVVVCVADYFLSKSENIMKHVEDEYEPGSRKPYRHQEFQPGNLGTYENDEHQPGWNEAYENREGRNRREGEADVKNNEADIAQNIDALLGKEKLARTKIVFEREIRLITLEYRGKGLHTPGFEAFKRGVRAFTKHSTEADRENVAAKKPYKQALAYLRGEQKIAEERDAARRKMLHSEHKMLMNGKKSQNESDHHIRNAERRINEEYFRKEQVLAEKYPEGAALYKERKEQWNQEKQQQQIKKDEILAKKIVLQEIAQKNARKMRKAQAAMHMQARGKSKRQEGIMPLEQKPGVQAQQYLGEPINETQGQEGEVQYLVDQSNQEKKQEQIKKDEILAEKIALQEIVQKNARKMKKAQAASAIQPQAQLQHRGYRSHHVGHNPPPHSYNAADRVKSGAGAKERSDFVR